MNKTLWHVLVIDDNPDDLADVRQMLLQDATRQYRFSEATLGADGLRLLNAAGAAYDCVLLDYHLPDMNAEDLLAQLRADRPLTPFPVVVLTGADSANRTEGRQVLRAGAQDYIGKHWTTPDSLTRALENAVQRFALALEREASASALRVSEQRFRDLLECAPDAMVIVDADGSIVLINAMTLAMFGYSAAELMGQPVEILAPARLHKRHREQRLAYAARPQPRAMGAGMQLVGRRKDGREFPIEVSLGSLAVSDGHWVSSAIRDISERKRAGDALAAALAEARSASNAKSDFLSRMSHELRTPLNAILGFGQLLETSMPAPSAAQLKSIAQILKAGWYLLDLINEILDLAQIESGTLALALAPVALGELLQDCRAMIEPMAAQRHIRLVFPDRHAAPLVKADQTRLKQLLLNLLSNAIKYNRPDGSVSVDCIAVDAGRTRIRVSDSGTGLDAQSIAALFRPFVRLGRENSGEQGTGIGLVVSKGLAELMGGRIGVESTPGIGSMFWIELDTAEVAEQALADRGRGSTA